MALKMAASVQTFSSSGRSQSGVISSCRGRRLNSSRAYSGCGGVLVSVHGIEKYRDDVGSGESKKREDGTDRLFCGIALVLVWRQIGVERECCGDSGRG
jgi:hypothetical protein